MTVPRKTMGAVTAGGGADVEVATGVGFGVGTGVGATVTTTMVGGGALVGTTVGWITTVGCVTTVGWTTTVACDTAVWTGPAVAVGVCVGRLGRCTRWRGVALAAAPAGVLVGVLVAAAVAARVPVAVGSSPSSSVVQAPKSNTPARISAVASKARIASLLRTAGRAIVPSVTIAPAMPS